MDSNLPTQTRCTATNLVLECSIIHQPTSNSNHPRTSNSTSRSKSNSNSSSRGHLNLRIRVDCSLARRRTRRMIIIRTHSLLMNSKIWMGDKSDQNSQMQREWNKHTRMSRNLHLPHVRNLAQLSQIQEIRIHTHNSISQEVNPESQHSQDLDSLGIRRRQV